MAEKSKQKRGAPKGRQRHHSHSFYTKVMDEAERLDFELASGVEGFDDEIALLRMEIRNLLEKEPENVDQILRAANTLVRLVQAKYNITGEQKQGLKKAIGNVLKDVAIPLGIKAITNIVQ